LSVRSLAGFSAPLFLKRHLVDPVQVFSIKVRLKNENQGSIDQQPVFNRNHDRNEFFEIKV